MLRASNTYHKIASNYEESLVCVWSFFVVPSSNSLAKKEISSINVSCSILFLATMQRVCALCGSCCMGWFCLCGPFCHGAFKFQPDNFVVIWYGPLGSWIFVVLIRKTSSAHALWGIRSVASSVSIDKQLQ